MLSPQNGLSLQSSLPKDESKYYKELENSEEGGKPPSMAIFEENLRGNLEQRSL